MQGEVAILEALAGSPRACQVRAARVSAATAAAPRDCSARVRPQGTPSPRAPLIHAQMYDYGVDPAADAMFLVLRDYRCSLRQWRARQPPAPTGQLRLYYTIFAEVRGSLGRCSLIQSCAAVALRRRAPRPCILWPNLSTAPMRRWRRRWAHCWTAASCTLTSSATTACWSHCRVSAVGGVGALAGRHVQRRCAGSGARLLARSRVPAAQPSEPRRAGVGDSEFWSPSSERLPFRVVLADFGESKLFRCVGCLGPCALRLGAKARPCRPRAAPSCWRACAGPPCAALPSTSTPLLASAPADVPARLLHAPLSPALTSLPTPAPCPAQRRRRRRGHGTRPRHRLLQVP